LTIPAAEEQLSSQVIDMQMLEDKSQYVNEKIGQVKDAIKEGTVAMDRLRSEKAELEKKVATHKVEADDGRAVDLCDWCVHCATFLSALELEKIHPGTHHLWRFTDHCSTCNHVDQFLKMSWCCHMQSTRQINLQIQKTSVL
jgi:hypothetical protein